LVARAEGARDEEGIVSTFGYRVALVPYREAREETKAAYLAGLREGRQLNANPPAWDCTVCGKKTAGEDILISYGEEIVTPLPYCPQTRDDGTPCNGHSGQLQPTEV
jgi:hypothetical protein